MREWSPRVRECFVYLCAFVWNCFALFLPGYLLRVSFFFLFVLSFRRVAARDINDRVVVGVHKSSVNKQKREFTSHDSWKLCFIFWAKMRFPACNEAAAAVWSAAQCAQLHEFLGTAATAVANSAIVLGSSKAMPQTQAARIPTLWLTSSTTTTTT